MTEVTSHAAGQPCWADATGPDVAAAARFYGELFGWEAETDPRPEAGAYTMFRRNGKSVAAASPPQAEGIPPHWTVYLAAEDVDAVAARIREAGGSVTVEPFDVLDAGRMALAADPAGAVFGVWQAGAHIGAELRGEPGTMNWAEVQTHDRDAAKPFYEHVFGYASTSMEIGPAVGYVVFELEGLPVAGLIEIGPEWGPVPSNWSVVFEVADCDAALARVKELGGSVLHGPMEIEGIGRFATVADPWGAVFQVIA